MIVAGIIFYTFMVFFTFGALSGVKTNVGAVSRLFYSIIWPVSWSYSLGLAYGKYGEKP